MAKENPDSGNELRKLYLSFTKAVEEGDDLMEFSSDDLLDVFDYALRGADEYIAGEAMIEGLRRAPGDGDFIKRKGFFMRLTMTRRVSVYSANSLRRSLSGLLSL